MIEPTEAPSAVLFRNASLALRNLRVGCPFFGTNVAGSRKDYQTNRPVISQVC
jgi:hypothetical protein